MVKTESTAGSRSAVALELLVTDMGLAVVGLKEELLDPTTCWWSKTSTRSVVVRCSVLLPPLQHSDHSEQENLKCQSLHHNLAISCPFFQECPA